jgi:signal peptidase I
MADDKPPQSAGAPQESPPPTAVSAQPMNLPPISLDPSAAPKPSPALGSQAKKDTEIKDSFRELIETIVFVVVLVLMLKTFLAEAFVIPTGSMADTLLGYHYKESCRDCGYTNLINASAEAEPANPLQPPRITHYKCSNCGKINDMPDRRGGP